MPKANKQPARERRKTTVAKSPAIPLAVPEDDRFPTAQQRMKICVDAIRELGDPNSLKLAAEAKEGTEELDTLMNQLVSSLSAVRSRLER